MKKLFLLITLVIVAGGVWATCPPLPAMAIGDASTGSFEPQAPDRDGGLTGHAPWPNGEPGRSCAEPRPGEEKACEEIEQRILASTVRIEWNLWVKGSDGSGYSRKDRTSHATVKQGRYLVTHNHSRALISEMKDKEFNRVSIFTADGTLIWPKGPLNTITIRAEDEEALVLDFGDYHGQGLFNMLGLSSAEFRTWEPLSLQAGMEVAQVTWDGKRSYVEWVTIDDVITSSGTPRLELDNPARLGTSGGGVFWNGYHVANTWCYAAIIGESGRALSRQFSVAALNSPQIAAHLN